MELSVKHFFISLQDQYGLIKLSITKNLENLELNLQYFRITNSDSQVLQNVFNNCNTNPTNRNLLRTVGNELVCGKTFNLRECELLSDSLEFIKTRDKNDKNFIKINLFDELKLPLTIRNINGIYDFIHSFYTNYNFLESVIRISLVNGEKQETVQKTIVKSDETIELEEIILVDNELEEIFGLILNNSIKSSLISNIFNYYFSVNNCEFVDNVIKTPNVFINSFGIDNVYIKSLILSNEMIDLDKVLHNLLKLYQMCLDEKYNKNSFYLIIMMYLITIYTIRIFLDIYPEYTRSKIYEILNNVELQENMLNKLLKSHNLFKMFKEKLKFVVFNSKNDFDSDINEEQLKKISEKYHYMKPISQTEFVNSIMNDLSNKIEDKSQQFLINSKKTINISNFLSQTSKNNQCNFFNIQNLTNNKEIEYNLLHYKTINNKIITKSYNYILEYVKNPIVVVNITDIPKSVVNMFDSLVKHVLNMETIDDKNINTLNFYKILREKLPNIDKLSHLTILFIIFQIIIPYSYDMYENDIFEDYLL